MEQSVPLYLTKLKEWENILTKQATNDEERTHYLNEVWNWSKLLNDERSKEQGRVTLLHCVCSELLPNLIKSLIENSFNPFWEDQKKGTPIKKILNSKVKLDAETSPKESSQEERKLKCIQALLAKLNYEDFRALTAPVFEKCLKKEYFHIAIFFVNCWKETAVRDPITEDILQLSLNSVCKLKYESPSTIALVECITKNFEDIKAFPLLKLLIKDLLPDTLKYLLSRKTPSKLEELRELLLLAAQRSWRNDGQDCFQHIWKQLPEEFGFSEYWDILFGTAAEGDTCVMEYLSMHKGNNEVEAEDKSDSTDLIKISVGKMMSIFWSNETLRKKALGNSYSSCSTELFNNEPANSLTKIFEKMPQALETILDGSAIYKRKGNLADPEIICSIRFLREDDEKIPDSKFLNRAVMKWKTRDQKRILTHPVTQYFLHKNIQECRKTLDTLIASQILWLFCLTTFALNNFTADPRIYGGFAFLFYIVVFFYTIISYGSNIYHLIKYTNEERAERDRDKEDTEKFIQINKTEEEKEDNDEENQDEEEMEGDKCDKTRGRIFGWCLNGLKCYRNITIFFGEFFTFCPTWTIWVGYGLAISLTITDVSLFYLNKLPEKYWAHVVKETIWISSLTAMCLDSHVSYTTRLYYVNVFCCVFIILYIILSFVHEIFECCESGCRKYFGRSSNIVQLLRNFLLSTALIWLGMEWEPFAVITIAGSASILMAYCLSMRHFRIVYQSTGQAIEILKEVVKRVTGVFFSCLLLLLGFTIAFIVIYSGPKADGFNTELNSTSTAATNISLNGSYATPFIKMMVLMSGEIDFSTLGETMQPENIVSLAEISIALARQLLLFSFLIGVVFAYFNQLTGVAIEGVTDLRDQADVSRMARNVEYIYFTQSLYRILKRINKTLGKVFGQNCVGEWINNIPLRLKSSEIRVKPTNFQSSVKRDWISRISKDLYPVRQPSKECFLKLKALATANSSFGKGCS